MAETMQFDHPEAAMAMRDIIAQLVSNELERQRPKYEYAVVTAISRSTNKCTVIFNGDTNAVDVNMGLIQPTKLGQTVRIEGVRGDRFVADVIGFDYSNYSTIGVQRNLGWTTVGPTDLLNSWTMLATGGSFGMPKFRKNPNGRVTMSGVVSNSSTSTSPFSLPSAYCAGHGLSEMFITYANADMARVDINMANGVITTPILTGGAGSFVGFDGISFVSGDVAESAWSYIGAAGQPAFTNSWVNFGSGWCTASYYKDAWGWVHLRGLIKSGSNAVPAFTLPAGYRPSEALMYLVASSGTKVGARMDVYTDGTVVPSNLTGGTNSYVSLSGISFYAGGNTGNFAGLRDLSADYAFANSWANFASGYGIARYRVDPDGYVALQGLVKSGTAAAAMFTKLMTANSLQAQESLVFGGVANAGAVRLDTGPTGDFKTNGYVNGGNNGYVSLSNIRYYPIGK